MGQYNLQYETTIQESFRKHDQKLQNTFSISKKGIDIGN